MELRFVCADWTADELPWRSPVTAPLTVLKMVLMGAAMALQRVGLASTSPAARRTSCSMKTAARPAFIKARIRPCAPLVKLQARNGL